MASSFRYDGSPTAWETVAEETDLVKAWIDGDASRSSYNKADNFEFIVDSTAVVVKINGSGEITLPAGAELNEPNIYSFVVVTTDTNFHYFARY